MNKKVYNLLGLAFRAKRCVLGEQNIVHSIQKNKAKIVLIASDIGKQTKKKLIDKSTYYHIPIRFVGDRYELGQALGEVQRVAVSVTDEGFAKKMTQLIDENQ